MRHTTNLEGIPELAMKWCALLGMEVCAAFEASGNEQLFPNRMALTGRDAHLLLAGKAQPMDALQFLLHEAQGEREDSKLAYLDVQGSRLFRMRELVAMAGLAAQKARQVGSYTFASLTPKERRWVHLVISNESGLETQSDGLGAVKSLKVLRKA